MRLLQLNLNHCEVAQDLLRQTVAEKQIDVAIVSEHYRRGDGCTWVADTTDKAAIWACGRFPVQEVAVRGEAGYVAARLDGVYVFSCHAPPSLDLHEFQQLMSKIADDARRHRPNIIAGDFNAWAEDWGSRHTNARGEALLEAFAGLDIVLANNGDTSTFRGSNGSSIVDLTFTSPALARGMRWNVSEEYSHSDHQAILFEINGQREGTTSGNHRQSRRRGWVAKSLEPETLVEMIREASPPDGTAEEMARSVTNELKAACDASMPKRMVNDRRQPVYWWTEAIGELRAKCHKARRRSQRAVGTARQDEERVKYAEIRGELRNEIRRSKKQCFKDLCDDADANIFGNAYRVVTSRIKGPRVPAERCPILLEKIITTLFPHQDPRWATDGDLPENADIPLVTVEELIKACKKVGAKKAPGPDEIPNTALKLAIEGNPSLFTGVMQKCLEEGTFPRDWKRQRLVLLPKAGKPPGDPSAYRPICLLDTIGKLLERLIQNRLEETTEGERPLSANQFGWTP